VFQEPKTEKSRALMPLTKIAARALRLQRQRQAEVRLAMGSAWQDQGLVFTTTKGTPLELSNVHREFKRLLEQAGLPRTVRIHDLRHSTAALLLNLGVDLKIIQEILRHSGIQVTADTYGHLADRIKREALDQLDQLLGSTSQ
jgi:integrase